MMYTQEVRLKHICFPWDTDPIQHYWGQAEQPWQLPQQRSDNCLIEGFITYADSDDWKNRK